MTESHNVTLPLFVTLTGADRTDYIPAMHTLSKTYNGQIEWGVLVSDEKKGHARFPFWETIDVFRTSGLRLSAHVCGTLAEHIFAGQDIDFDFSGFKRIQINKLGQHANPEEVENAIAFGRKHGIRTILQCGHDFPKDMRADWLMDNSFGQGKSLEYVPLLQDTGVFCGISGGLSADNIQDVLKSSAPKTHNRPYWIDTESALFVESAFCLTACTRFAEKAFSLNTF